MGYCGWRTAKTVARENSGRGERSPKKSFQEAVNGFIDDRGLAILRNESCRSKKTRDIQKEVFWGPVIVRLLKETPLGEYPNLAMWVEAFGQYHLAFQIDHLREVLQASGGGAAV